ncbi:MAG: hypothetical protein ACXAB7_12905 [Candidatus Kariarchaeaceae archaeon]
MSKRKKDKNIRLTSDAWSELRLIKFEEGMPTYSDVFKMLFDGIEGEPNIEEQMNIKQKLPKDTGKSTDEKKSDKTIVINEDMHRKLAEYKVKYMIESGATSRGPDAVSISDVVLAVIKMYKEQTP